MHAPAFERKDRGEGERASERVNKRPRARERERKRDKERKKVRKRERGAPCLRFQCFSRATTLSDALVSRSVTKLPNVIHAPLRYVTPFRRRGERERTKRGETLEEETNERNNNCIGENRYASKKEGKKEKHEYCERRLVTVCESSS